MHTELNTQLQGSLEASPGTPNLDLSILGTIHHSLRYPMNIYQSLGAKDTKMAAQASPQVVGKLMGDLHRYPETKLL